MLFQIPKKSKMLTIANSCWDGLFLLRLLLVVFRMMDHWVMASWMPRVASREAGEGSPSSTDHAKLGVGVKRILRTCGSEATRGRFKRREIVSIKVDEREAHSSSP